MRPEGSPPAAAAGCGGALGALGALGGAGALAGLERERAGTLGGGEPLGPVGGDGAGRAEP